MLTFNLLVVKLANAALSLPTSHVAALVDDGTIDRDG
jgi:hypothetical protein